MLDETIITETPPLYSCYCRIGEQKLVPITGNRQKRILHGALNIISGECLLLITKEWDALTHQYFLEMIRRHWRGWQITLFEDRGSPHTAEDTEDVVVSLKIEVRLLPRATPELNAMDHLWRYVKQHSVGDRQTLSIDKSADLVCADIYAMSRHERLTRAGVLSGNFWLTKRN